ncbi:MAG: DUF2868 domain-containing protein [Deltaproteobacteria bacterium]|nr:DUF2868 domain-containing protein [Deltaproteobacteria bacterium]
MRELAAQAVLLARSFEEADPEGALLEPRERQRATAEARAAGGPYEEQARHRAALLLERVRSRVGGIDRVLAWTRVSPRFAVLVIGIAFAVGLSTNALGPTRRINLLAFPLLTLLVWNLGVYLALAIEALFSRGHARSVSAPEDADAPPQAVVNRSEEAPRGALRSLAWSLGAWAQGRAYTGDRRQADVASHALAAYWNAWWRKTSSLAIARVRLFLHLGAAALATGVVAGMYLRGLGLEYRATWESTFLGADTVAALLRLVLGPAAGVFGFPLPDADALEAMAGPSGSAPAAIWIHLWALTTAGIVVVPRLALALVELARSIRLARNVDVEPLEGSFRTLLTSERGAALTIEVQPYSYQLASGQGALRELLHDLFGLEARIDVRPTVTYGGDANYESRSEDGSACVIVVFGVNQSPEREVHGRYLEELMEIGGGRLKLLALVDTAAWRARFGDHEDRRAAERLRAWDRVVRGAGMQVVAVDLAHPPAPGLVERAESALWPNPAAARAGLGA